MKPLRSCPPGPIAASALIVWAAAACGQEKVESPVQESKTVEPATPGDKATPPPPPAQDEASWYRAVFTLEKSGDLAFFLRLPRSPLTGEGTILNDSERVPIDYEWKGNALTARGRWIYPTELVAQQEPDGSLRGTFTRDIPLWGAVTLPFAAKRIDKPDGTLRYPGEPPTVDASGVWKVRFRENGPGKARIQVGPDGVASGAFRPAGMGDVRFLSGNVHGNKLILSTFNGNVANLLQATISPDGKGMTGTLSMYDAFIDDFTAEKVPDFELGNPTHLKKGKKKLTVPQLKSYRGKPVLMTILATWCPACNDLTPFLVKMYGDYHPKGLEAVTVMYDLSEDEKANAQNIEEFTRKYGVTWRVDHRETTPEKWPSDMPPEIQGWMGFPVLAWVRGDGSVYKVYSGYYSPAAQPEHDQLNRQFTQWTDELLAGK